MVFETTNDEVLYLYPYYSIKEKSDEMSKTVYHVFKKGWDTYLTDIYTDLYDAVVNYFVQNEMKNLKVAVTVMPSHLRGMYGESLLKVAKYLARDFGFVDSSKLIQRTVDKIKSTEGGARDEEAHLVTLGLSYPIDNSVDVYIILDDITTTGSSLRAAKRLLISNGVNPNNIIKIAVAKTTHDDDY